MVVKSQDILNLIEWIKSIEEKRLKDAVIAKIVSRLLEEGESLTNIDILVGDLK